MQENSLSVVPRDVMLNELGNAELLGGYIQSNDQINPSQFQDAAMYPYQAKDDFSFAVSPIQDSIPFGFLGADEIEGFNNYVGDCDSLQTAGGAPEHFLGDCQFSKVVEGAHTHVLDGCELLKVIGGVHEHFLGDCEPLKAVGGAHEHVSSDYELLKVGGAHEQVSGDCESSKLGGSHEHVLGHCEMLKVGGAHEHVLGYCELLKTVGGVHEHVLGDCESLKAVGGAPEHLDAGIAVENVSVQETEWSDKMLKVLITAVSYLGEEYALPYTTKSVWEAISEAMVQRGYTVTPQQCQDKFQDLKFKYERFYALLGNDACYVFENPILLEFLELSDEAKGEVRDLIYCKQLFLKEMCSCLNGNRILPLDFPLIRSLARALTSKLLPGSEMPSKGVSVKRKRPLEDHLGKSLPPPSNANASSGEGAKTNEELLPKLQEQKVELLAVPSNANASRGEGAKTYEERLLKLQERKAKLSAKRLEFEKDRFEWLKSNQNLEWEMKQMRLKNEFLKLENQRLALELQTGTLFRG